MRLTDGRHVEVETLLWTPPAEPATLIATITDTLGLDVDEHGLVIADDSQHTNVDRLWAVGDAHTGFAGSIAAANAASTAASMIVHGWFDPEGTR